MYGTNNGGYNGFGQQSVPSFREISYDQQFEPGTVISYQCMTDRLDVLKVSGPYINRTCQTDGTWIGSRPYCGKYLISHFSLDSELLKKKLC